MIDCPDGVSERLVRAGGGTICRRGLHRITDRHGEKDLYDPGAAAVTQMLASRLGIPAVLSTFSRLLIDANRGEDDPTLIMRLSDGAVVPGNAAADADERARRRGSLSPLSTFRSIPTARW